MITWVIALKYRLWTHNESMRPIACHNRIFAVAMKCKAMNLVEDYMDYPIIPTHHANRVENCWTIEAIWKVYSMVTPNSLGGYGIISTYHVHVLFATYMRGCPRVILPLLLNVGSLTCDKDPPLVNSTKHGKSMKISGGGAGRKLKPLPPSQ